VASPPQTVSWLRKVAGHSAERPLRGLKLGTLASAGGRSVMLPSSQDERIIVNCASSSRTAAPCWGSVLRETEGYATRGDVCHYQCWVLPVSFAGPFFTR
jgi:hypothetical protein